MNSMKWIIEGTSTQEEVEEQLGFGDNTLQSYSLPVKITDPQVAERFLDKGLSRSTVFLESDAEQLCPMKIYVLKDTGECVYLELSDSKGKSYSYISHSEYELLHQIQEDNKQAIEKKPSLESKFRGWKGYEDVSGEMGDGHQQFVNNQQNEITNDFSLKI